MQDFEFDKIGNAFVTFFEALKLRNFKLSRHVFINPFIKWLLSTYCVPSIFLGS